MALFNHKKEDRLPEELPPLPPLESTRLGEGSQKLPPLPEKDELHNIVAPEEDSQLFPEIPSEEPPKELPPFPDEVVAPKLKNIEDKEVKIQKKELKELHKRVAGKPLFVSVEDFREVLGNLDSIKIELRNHDKILEELNEIKNSQDKLFDSWHSKIKDLERKFIFVDKTLFETNYV